MENEKTLLELAHELQAIASAGLLYSRDRFDLERFQRVRDIAAELVSSETGLPFAQIQTLFSENDGYQTPKTSTRAVIFNSRGEVLLVRDYDGQWTLPGGWCDFDQTIASNVVKEAREEAGLTVEPWRLVCVHDHRSRNNAQSFFHCLQYFVLCNVLGGSFQPNSETTESGYFPLDALPKLNLHKTTPEQLRLCWEARNATHWETQFD
ncbi:MAG: NUDIX hydrolase N-terminal domain-containing protein [Clostridiales bacterium]|nr:NUDIX hydrolase N-terminal domain-containing protein [Clostridiales bacterium]